MILYATFGTILEGEFPSLAKAFSRFKCLGQTSSPIQHSVVLFKVDLTLT